MAFGVLAGQITVIFLEVLLGYVGARSGIIKDRDSKFLSDFIMKLLLPCTMLAGAAVDGEPELLTQAGVLFVLLLALFVVTTGLCRLSSWRHSTGRAGPAPPQRRCCWQEIPVCVPKRHSPARSGR